MESRVRRSLAVLAATAGLLAPAAAAAPTPTDHRLAVSGRDCGQVVFTPRSDDLAGGITASHVGCDRARRHIRRLHARGVEPSSFECRQRVHRDVLTHTDHRCENGDRTYSWQRF